jgi:hypothetical protein
MENTEPRKSIYVDISPKCESATVLPVGEPVKEWLLFKGPGVRPEKRQTDPQDKNWTMKIKFNAFDPEDKTMKLVSVPFTLWKTIDATIKRKPGFVINLGRTGQGKGNVNYFADPVSELSDEDKKLVQHLKRHELTIKEEAPKKPAQSNTKTDDALPF